MARKPVTGGLMLANLQNVWRSATPDEKQELCSIILAKIVYDFELRKITKIVAKGEYGILFKMVEHPNLQIESFTENNEL